MNLRKNRLQQIFPPNASVDIVKYDQQKLDVFASKTQPNSSRVMFKYEVADYTGYCPADKIVTVLPGFGSAVVRTSIPGDPVRLS